MNALVPMNTAPAMTVSDVERVANAIARGGLFGSKDPNAVLTLCLLAQAEGQHPAVVFRDYHIIQGKPAKKAEAMLRDFINAGGKVEWNRLDDECADATFTHPSGSARIDWTLERARKAGISTAMWQKYPRQMLRSRVISEGIRTVYPGATSGLYEEGEVASFDAPREAYSGDSNAALHDTQTGEVIEEETIDPKIPGITKIRNNLNKLRRDGGKAVDLEAFNALVHTYAADLEKIRDAHHSLWTGMGEDFDGFNRWIRVRRAELTPQEQSLSLQMLLSLIDESKGYTDLQGIIDEHGQALDELEDAERRRFETAYNDKEAQLLAKKAPTPLETGLVGG